LRHNPENQFRVLYNDHRILIALKQAGPSRFTDIHKEIRSSQRTLAKHLKMLVTEGMVRKLGRLYGITELGLGTIERLESQMEELRQYKKIAPIESSQETREPEEEVKRSGHLMGTFQGPRPAISQDVEGQQVAEPPAQASPVTDHSKDESIFPETRKSKGSVGGPRSIGNIGNRFFLYISPEITRDQAFPFRPGTPLTLEIQQDCLVIRANEKERTRVPVVSPNPITCWFKGVCRIVTRTIEG